MDSFRFLGVLCPALEPEGAEIKPVEPDQGNACAGKVVYHFYASLSQHFSQINFNRFFRGRFSDRTPDIRANI